MNCEPPTRTYVNDRPSRLTPPRGCLTCPTCGQAIRLTDGGRVKTHYVSGGRVCSNSLKFLPDQD